MIVKSTKESANEVKLLFRELPYNSFNFIDFHGQFINSLNTGLPTKAYLQRLTSVHEINLFSLNTDSNVNLDQNLNRQPIHSRYYSPHSYIVIPLVILFSLIMLEAYAAISKIFKSIYLTNSSYTV